MLTRLRSADGYAVPIALMLMVIMLGFGFASLGFVDGETKSSRVERTHEARLNLTEGVLAAQIFQLSRGWPSAVEKEMPLSCTQGDAAPSCPQPSQLEGQFAQIDMNLGPEWIVQVRDDDATVADPNAGQYYDDATVLDNARWDANVNGEMWVRAEAQLGDKPRVLVARVRVEQRPVTPPAAPFVAGAFETGNNSPNKVIISSPLPGVVRCETSSTSDTCIKYVSGQIEPVGKVESNPDLGSVLGDGMSEALRQTAKAKGTYYATCADVPGGNPSGEVVWVESGNCIFQGNMIVNPVTKRGLFVINNGTLTLRGSVQWWGMLYVLNEQGCGSTTDASPCLGTDTVAEVTGTPTIFGGLFIEGAGRLTTGNSGGSGNCQQCDPQIVYREESGQPVTAYGTAGIIQNTWRELLPN